MNTNMEETKEDDESFKKLDKLESEIIKKLSKYEWKIVSFQSVLVWEKPYHSAAFLGLVNLIFWMAANLRFYHLVGIVGVIFTTLDMWSNKIWPEIRVKPAPGEDMDDWAPIFPKFVSIQEIARFAASTILYLQDIKNQTLILRQTNYPVFFVKSICFLIGIYALGCYFSITFLVYIFVMSMILYPLAHYHDIPKKAQDSILPHLISFQKSFQTSKRLRKSKLSLPAMMRSHEDDSDSDLDLIPSHVEKSSDANSENTDDKSNISLDDNISIEEFDKTGDSLGLSLSEMPAHEDLDSTLNSTFGLKTANEDTDDTDNDCDSSCLMDSEFEFLNKE